MSSKLLSRLSKSPRRVARAEIYTRKREKKRLARLHVKYNPFKRIGYQHDVKLRSRFQVPDTVLGTTRLSAPENMDFRVHFNETVEFLDQVHQAILTGKERNVVLDLSKLDAISPEAAIVFLAETVRCLFYSVSKKKLRGNYPRSARARKMLGDIGFFKSFNIPTPPVEPQESQRIYFQTVFGNRSDGRLAQPLLSLFQNVGQLDSIACKRLYASLIECMDNVKAHAYPIENEGSPDLVGEWWMAGFADKATGQIAMIFFDQGAGIPTTIKRKRSVRIRSYFHFSDDRIIRRAVLKGLSRKSSLRHGNGLPSLKEFVDVSKNGMLRLISNYGDFTYYKSQAPKAIALPRHFRGSLIVWTIHQAMNIPIKTQDADELFEDSPLGVVEE